MVVHEICVELSQADFLIEHDFYVFPAIEKIFLRLREQETDLTVGTPKAPCGKALTSRCS